MLTEFGKEVRRLRIDIGERLLDMAKKLGRSSAFISAIETGQKSLPSSFEEELIKIYNLNEQQADKIRQAANRSRKYFSLEPKKTYQKDMVGIMARKMNNLSVEEVNKILAILQKGSGDEQS